MKYARLAVLLVSFLAGWSLGAPPHALAGPDAAPGTPAVWDSLQVLEAAGRWRDADRIASDLLRTFDVTPVTDSLALARALDRHAQYRRTLGLLADGIAQQSAERAATIAERLRPRDTGLICLAHSTAAIVHIDLAEGDSALAHVRRAQEFAAAERPPRDSVLGVLYFREGQAERVREDYPAAIRALRRARELTIHRLGPDAPGLVSISTELGRSYAYMGEYDSARVEQEYAVRVSERPSGNTELLQRALSSLSLLERRAGNPARAVELATRAYEVCVAHSGEANLTASSFLANVAAALLALGDYAGARTLLERVLAQQETALPPTHSTLAIHRASLALACVKSDDLPAAHANLDLADSILARSHAHEPSTSAYIASVRTVLDMREFRFGDARRRLLATAADENSLAPASQLELAAQLLETMRAPSDRALTDSLGLALDRLADTTNVAQTKNWPFAVMDRALAEEHVGERARAWVHARAADSLEGLRLRAEIADLPDRAALLHDEDAADAAVLLVDLARPGRDDEVRTAWDAIVRRRGAVRAVVGARRELLDGGDSTLAAAYAAWVAASHHHAQLVVAGALDSGDPAARARFEASRTAAEEAEAHYAELAAAHGRAADTVSLGGVLARLQPGEALVAFVRTGDGYDGQRLSALVARAGATSPQLVRLGDETPIEAAVDAWVARLATPPPAGLAAAHAAEAAASAAGAEVRREVWDPLAPALAGAGDVYLVPAGPVHDLPWLALPLANGCYLAEGALRLHVLGAERELARRERERARGGLLAVGDPDFDRAPDSAAAAPAHAGRRLPGSCARAGETLGALPGAREEAREIAKAWSLEPAHGPVELLIGDEATERRFKLLAPGHRVIHVATHGVLMRDSCAASQVAMRGVGGVAALASMPPPPRSRGRAAPPAPASRHATSEASSPWLGRDVLLAFAGANRAAGDGGNENDGWLTADEVATLDLRGTDRVVLSACQSGVADRWSHEALLGMRRAFHLAGARCVVASQWPIADQSTREWMRAFYASPSPSGGTAVQAAASEVIRNRRARGQTTHPFYWAAFTATGD